MSRVFLPNGGQIEIHTTWKSKSQQDGVIELYSHDEQTFLGHIANGLVHLTSSCHHSFYPPSIHTNTEAIRIVKENIKDLSVYELKNLKKMLNDFDAKKCEWK